MPNSHLIFGGDEWWFHGPKIFAGDSITNEKIPYDYVLKLTVNGPELLESEDEYRQPPPVPVRPNTLCNQALLPLPRCRE